MAACRMSILTRPRDAVVRGEILGGPGHVGVGKAARSEWRAVIGDSVRRAHWGGRGALDAPGDPRTLVARADGCDCIDDRRQSAPALAVDGPAGNPLAEARQQGG